MLQLRSCRVHAGVPAMRRTMATVATSAKNKSKKEGSIADAFVSLSGKERPPLPERFKTLKQRLAQGHESELVESWTRLLRALKAENEIVKRDGSMVIPQVDFKDMENGIDRLKGDIRKRGVVVVRGVVPEDEARAFKQEIEEYVGKNPSTRAFPADNPQVFELYWSAPQLKARSHPALIQVQKQLMSLLWHKTSPTAPISITNPLSYADRLRIRQPGDAAFALGPHVDGGSVERWEPEGYGRGGVYNRVFEGRWEEFDPWDASGRVDAVNNLYDGLGACSMFRMWQGWLSMSSTGPKEGTLLVNPLMKLSTAYTLLRPFFRPVSENKAAPGFLDENNWVFEGHDGMTSELQGATPGAGQELTDELHPHLELEHTMVHVPPIKPGDYVAWHCDTIHAVDKVHQGSSDSSVLYIPVCPTTALNAEYLATQRAAFRAGTPGPDFPGGRGEADHVDRPAEAAITGGLGRAAMGLERLGINDGATQGERDVVAKANAILGF